LEVSSLMEQLVSICNQPAPDLSAENGWVFQRKIK
jgi:hypothetical protein